NAVAVPKISPLSLHDALPISQPVVAPVPDLTVAPMFRPVPTSVATSRALSRSAGSPEITGTTPRPVRKVYVEEDPFGPVGIRARSEEHTSELQSRENLVCRLL